MKFYDTSSLLLLSNDVFTNADEIFCTSSVVLNELENIKTSKRKMESTRYDARQLIQKMYENRDKYNVVLCTNKHYDILNKFDMPVTNDNLIVACAYDYQRQHPVVTVEFCTNDIVLSLIASCVFNLHVTDVLIPTKCEYKGFTVVESDNEYLTDFYNNPSNCGNVFNCKTNEYVIVKGIDGKVDSNVYKWTGVEYIKCSNKPIKTLIFGDKLKAKDVYQQMAIDSIMNNTITAIAGEAGSGKSLLSLMCAMYLIETGKYDRLIILFNPTAARGAAQLGYYQGTMYDKALQTSIGNILITKFGDALAVDRLIKQDKLRLVSMADQRGMEIRDNEILWITECQNCDVDLLKLCLSRASEEAKVIIEGDYKSQVDSSLFEGKNNGLRRAIETFAGEDIFGYVELQNVWRSKLCEMVCKL